MFIQRICFEKLNTAIKRQPAVALLGARQVGKTTLALEYARGQDHVYLDLENSEDRQNLTDPAFFLRQFEHKLVVLDEIQRAPELFPELRGLIDQGRRRGLTSGRFLILGSASVDLLRQSSESLAGRIEHVGLSPLSVAEVGVNKLVKLWLRGGFPLSFLASSDNDSLVWRKNFVRTYVEKDMLQFNPRVPTELLTRLWTMLGHNHGTMLNSSRLATSLEVSSPTVSRHVGFLDDLLLVRRLNPFSANLGKRLIKSPKVYIRDSGVLHALLNLQSNDELMRHPICGFSWEGFVIEQVIEATKDHATPLFYRTVDGAEVDLLLEWHRTGDLWAIEIKQSMQRPPSRGFFSAIDSLNPRRSFVVCMQQRPHRIRRDVEVQGLSEFLRVLVDETSGSG